MLALAGMFSQSYGIDLADDNTEGLISARRFDEATLSMTCPGKTPSTITFKNLEQSSREPKDLEIELIHMPHTCINKRAHLEPCVPHDWEMKSYFGCEYVSEGNEEYKLVTEGSKPWLEWISVDGIRIDQIAKVNCTAPTEAQFMRLAQYDFQGGLATATVNLVHLTNGTADGAYTRIPHKGEHGTNVFTMSDLLMPPMAPSPPASPPAPGLPWGTPGDSSPGWMYRLNEKYISQWDFYKYDRMTKMCYSTKNGDSFSSNVWHSKCNGKGATIWFANTMTSGKLYVAGGYTRNTWAGGGYSSDSYAHLFHFNHAKQGWATKAGSGPHAGSNYAIYRSNGYGPTWGNAHDWYVTSNMKTGYNNLGYAYKCRIGNYGQNACQNDFFGSYSSWSIAEAEMWSEN